MKIAILSGKGGTGKTTVSVNLASLSGQCTLLDCDVEEPNAHLYLKPKEKIETPIQTYYPEIDEEKCTHCGKCARFCNYNAFISSPKVTIPLRELCHFCGGCIRVCPEGAITYKPRRIGTLWSAQCNEIDFNYGILNVGEMSGVKIIEKLINKPHKSNLIWIDAPPGSACSAVAAVEDADFVLLVTEPTPFGLSDMEMVIEMLDDMKKDYSVIINKSGIGDESVKNFCDSRSIEILGEIPFSREAAEASSKGKLLIETSPKYFQSFSMILEKILSKVNNRLKDNQTQEKYNNEE